MKMYCVISKESLARMQGIRGKMMAQAGHAFLHAFWDTEERFPVLAKAYKDGQHSKKVTLVTQTDEEMLELFERYSSVCGTTKVVDAGFTVFAGPTLTCIGIGPMTEELMGDDLKALKTLT